MLDEIVNAPHHYTNGTVTVTGAVSTPIEGANAWILEANDDNVLLIGPPDRSSRQDVWKRRPAAAHT